MIGAVDVADEVTNADGESVAAAAEVVSRRMNEASTRSTTGESPGRVLSLLAPLEPSLPTV